MCVPHLGHSMGAGRGGVKWRTLSLDWAPSIQTNQPKKPSATGITGSPKATACNPRTLTESSQSKQSQRFFHGFHQRSNRLPDLGAISFKDALDPAV